MSDVELEWFRLDRGWALSVHLPREALERLAADGSCSEVLEAEEGADFPHVTEFSIRVVGEG
jgi:hypothetical protein